MSPFSNRTSLDASAQRVVVDVEGGHGLAALGVNLDHARTHLAVGPPAMYSAVITVAARETR